MADLKPIVPVYAGKPASASNFNKIIFNIRALDEDLADDEQQNADFDQYIQDTEALIAGWQDDVSTFENSAPDLTLFGGAWSNTGSLPSEFSGALVWAWDTEIESASGISISGDWQTFTVHEAGLWKIDASLQLSGLASDPGFYLYLMPLTGSGYAKSGGNMIANSVTFTAHFDAGDQFQLEGFIATFGVDPSVVRIDLNPMLHAWKVG